MPAAESVQAVRVLEDGTQVVRIVVTGDGYRPAAVAARPGVRTRLELHADRATGCTRAFVIASRGIQQILPDHGTVGIDLGRPKPGVLHYSCAMGTYSGRILFRAPDAGGVVL
jgi:plastocyanin domain-containing protein